MCVHAHSSLPHLIPSNSTAWIFVFRHFLLSTHWMDSVYKPIVETEFNLNLCLTEQKGEKKQRFQRNKVSLHDNMLEPKRNETEKENTKKKIQSKIIITANFVINKIIVTTDESCWILFSLALFFWARNALWMCVCCFVQRNISKSNIA